MRFTSDVVNSSETMRGKGEFSSLERLQIAGLYLPIIGATVVGFVASALVGKLSLALAGLGIVAYVLGLRHGIDADHIAAIDNTTRKLMQEGKKPLAVGTWFSLGHSTMVVGLIIALVLSTRAVLGSIPGLASTGAIIGTTISGTFLWLIGLVNVIIVLGLYKIYKQLRIGELNSRELESLLGGRGLMSRYFSPLFRIIKKPWQIYPVGILFGLGFDTASEVALVAISVGVGVSSGIPITAVLILPFMFTCGMVLVDTTDGVAMRMAYSWAFSNPIRKVYYNLTVTIISVLVAFLIGGLELMQVISGELNLQGAYWIWFGNLNFETLGIMIVAIFLVSWIASFAIYKFKKIDSAPIPLANSQS